MEITYKKSGNKNNLIVSDIGIKETDYRLNMVMNNDIYGLIPVSMRYIDGKLQLNYDITSMYSLENQFSRYKMKGEELYGLINCIYKVTQSMKEYLLDINNICLSAESVFVDRNTKEFKFCYVPQNETYFQENARKFFDEILHYIDHNDKSAVLIAYSIEQITVGDNFTAKDLFDIAKENTKEKEAPVEIPKVRIKNNVETIVDSEEKDNIDNQIVDKEENKLKKFINKIAEKLGLGTVYSGEDELVYNPVIEDEVSMYNTRNVEENNIESVIDLDKEIDVNNTFEDEVWKKALAQNEGEARNENDLKTGCLDTTESETMLLTYTGMSKPLILTNKIGNMEIKPLKYPCILGKSERSSDIVINSKAVSRVHLRLLQIEDDYYIEDLNSTNGTFLNNKQLNPHSPQKINTGDCLMLADVEFMVE